MVFDFIDGRWVSVTAAPAQCPDAAGKPINVDAWQTFTLEPKADGTMAGSYTNRSSVGGACFSSTQSVTVTRTAGDDPLAYVADPGAQPARVVSPASRAVGDVSAPDRRTRTRDRSTRRRPTRGRRTACAPATGV